MLILQRMEADQTKDEYKDGPADFMFHCLPSPTPPYPNPKQYLDQLLEFRGGFRISQRGTNPKDGGTILLFGQLFLKSAWKWRKLDWGRPTPKM